ncbi:MAG: DUF4132 domain-containing protein [Rhodoferax sp.]|nr:DUF4132 domain-containing protein [Rhodoferax sp.]
MAKTKAKTDPFLARPDDSRATSAWLTKLQAHAASAKILPTIPLDVNIVLVRPRHTDAFLNDWDSLIQWHGPGVFDHLAAHLTDKRIVKLVDSFRTDAAQALLLGRLNLPEVREVVAERAERWPLYTLRGLLALNPSRDQPAAQLLQRLLYTHTEWLAPLQAALAAEGDEAQSRTLARLLVPTEKVTEASFDELPALLRTPPWRSNAARVELPVLALTPRREPALVDWSRWRGGTVEPRPQMRSSYSSDGRFQVEEDFMWCLDYTLKAGDDEVAALRRHYKTDWNLSALALFLWGVKPDHIATVQANNALGPDDLRQPPGRTEKLLNHLGHLDDALALFLLRLQSRSPVTGGYYYESMYGAPDTCGNPVTRLLKRFGAEHIDAILPVMPPATTKGAQMIMEIVDSDALALRLSQFVYAVRSQLRTFARNWLLAHPQTSARALIPVAFSADAENAAHARQNLLLLANEGYAAVLRAQAQTYGASALAAVEALLATPAEALLEALLPPQLPKIPAWLILPRLPRLLLENSGHAVPLANMPDALMPLALSKGGMGYAGLDLLQAAVTPESLARLMLGLFEQWLDNGMPPKDRWIFELQGRLGNDANARALAPRIREWRSHLDRVRSYEGLEMLARIGSDTALMLLSTFSEQKRYGDLQERAAKALARVAEERDLTLEQLADRTVPTLGLDERGRLQLDFGPRQFTASLDLDLLPQVHDEAGKRLKDLPKPGAKDDAALAKDAVADWKEFKKQAKLVASTQNVRLEAAMCGQRRWPVADFLAFFAQHPVLRTLCQRLVWAAFDAAGAVAASFRVSEDLSLVDVDDAPCAPDAAYCIGLPHVLELAQDLRSRWLALLADYEILQPFEQLVRATYAMTAEEMSLNVLPRYKDRKLSTGSLLGLEQRGWKRGIGDGGMVDSLTKPLDDQHSAVLYLGYSEWFTGAAPDVNEEQEIRGLNLVGRTGATPSPAWSDLSAIVRSEMLRDLERLAWHTRD